jgi:hypothetical protein
MAITSTTIDCSFVANDIKSAGSTTTTAATNKRDSYAFTAGTGSLQANGVIDPVITIASNSTVTTLGSLLTTGGASFAFTGLKGLRLYNAGTNGNVTITSNITGFPACTLPPDSALVFTTSNATGLAIASTNTITANGITGNILVCTMLVS